MPENIYSVQWFPGHMAKTRRKMAENLKLVDGVVELVDARIPISSRNPDLHDILERKPRLILFNKSDAADEGQNKRWIQHYRQSGLIALPVDCRSGRGLTALVPAVRELLQEKIDRWEQKGMSGHNIRLMIVGVPNVGKSSFINRMAKGAKAKVADRPGVTRGNQWFTIGKGLELLDTPGVLWPKFDDPLVGERLAFTGAVKDEILDVETLAARLLETLREHYGTCVTQRYGLENPESLKGHEMLAWIGKKRGMLIAGGEIDMQRAAVMVLDEFRSGMLGRITLEFCKGSDTEEV